MIEVVSLPLPAPGFARFTYPRFRPLLEGTPKEEERITALAALADGVPAGLALVRHDERSLGETDAHARLLSIMVAAGARRRGIGSALLREAALAARRDGTSRLVAYHSNRMRDQEGYEAFLAANAWPAPVLAEFRLAGEADWFLRAPVGWDRILARLARLGYAAEPWDRVSAVDLARMDALGAPARFNHRIFAPHSDLAISLVLRRHGAPVGWIFGETRPGEGVHHYTNGWVIPELQSLGWVIAGLIDVCRHQAEVYGPKSVAVYETLGRNDRMIGFMRRRLAPLSPLWMDERYASTRVLA